MPRTLYEKLWDAHVVTQAADDKALLYIDRHLLHEVSTPQSFAALREDGLTVRRPETQLAVADHSVPTHSRAQGIDDPQAAAQIALLERNCAEFGIEYLRLDGEDQGIVHVIGPEQGFTLPGITLVCGDSHTSTHGAFGALAFGIGASECGTVMATQTLWQTKAKTMRVSFTGRLAPGVTAKDMALAFIGRVGASGGTGYALEFAGEAVSALSMEGRMTLCNMAIEAGSRTALIAPDEKTFAFVAGRRRAPTGAQWAAALAYWQSLASDHDAAFERDIAIAADGIAPQVTFGTSPDQVVPIDGVVPGGDGLAQPMRYMDVHAGETLQGLAIDHAFIGSCTNGRIEDLRAAAAVIRGRRVAPTVRGLVVPGSMRVKAEAEAEGLDALFIAAGFEWREPGCSLCVAMNSDRLPAGARCASTSNRNFEGRQGPGARDAFDEPAYGRGRGDRGPYRRRAVGLRMTPLKTVTGQAVSLPDADVDTDIIYPARFLLITEKQGLGRYAFADRRGQPGFPFRDHGEQRPILIAGPNFGCGSSREQAPWAIGDLGIRVIIASSFGEIFYSNCFRNGMLPIRLAAAEVERLRAQAEAGATIRVDLERQIIEAATLPPIAFDIAAERREALLMGWNDTLRILTLHGQDIAQFETAQRRAAPWLWTARN